MEIEMSALPKTWILDLDGTIVKHNGYMIDGKDTLLDGIKDFLDQITDNDMIIFITSRKKQFASITEEFLKNNHIRYDMIIYDAPYGERIIVNDEKPSGLKMAYALNTKRNIVTKSIVKRNPDL